MSDDIQLAILAELRKINEVLRPRRQHLSYADFEMLSELVPAIIGKYGADSTFTVRDLLKMPIFRTLTNRMTPRALGELFSRAAYQDIDGMMIKRVKFDHGRAVWCITVTSPD